MKKLDLENAFAQFLPSCWKCLSGCKGGFAVRLAVASAFYDEE